MQIFRVHFESNTVRVAVIPLLFVKSNRGTCYRFKVSRTSETDVIDRTWSDGGLGVCDLRRTPRRSWQYPCTRISSTVRVRLHKQISPRNCRTSDSQCAWIDACAPHAWSMCVSSSTYKYSSGSRKVSVGRLSTRLRVGGACNLSREDAARGCLSNIARQSWKNIVHMTLNEFDFRPVDPWR